jgi:hypothetical protein
MARSQRLIEGDFVDKTFTQKIPLSPPFPKWEITHPYTPLERGKKDSGPSKMTAGKQARMTDLKNLNNL